MTSAAYQNACLDAMGVTRWVRRGLAAEPASEPADSATALEALAADVARCTRCGLCEGRTRTVFGVGDPGADWMIIGEGPGREEDRQGEPFVGQAGRLLDHMLRAVGLARGQVYIANVVKCRPPKNRNPRPDEVAECMPYLQRQIELVRPRVILAAGRVPAQNLLGVEAPLRRLRGRVHELPGYGIPVIVTYHPAYLLRTPADKRHSWDDLCLARRQLTGGRA